jgi:putative PIN family toxin of toxin-antitoxin system
MKIMLDTNILISAAVFESKRISLYLNLILDRYVPCICTYSLFELFDNIDRKFQHRRTGVEAFLNKLIYKVIDTPETDKSALPYIRDEKDYPILAAAIAADVDVLISGDKDFLAVEIDRPEIMTISEFAEKYIK